MTEFLRAPAGGARRKPNRVLHVCVLIALLLELTYTIFSGAPPLMSIAMASGIASLVFVWRQPLVPLLVNFAVAIPLGPMPLAILVAYFVVVSARSLSIRVVLPTAIVFLAYLRPWDPRFFVDGFWAMSILVAAISTGLTLGVGVLVFTRGALLQALADLDEANEEARLVAAHAAAAAERARISREMHDVVSHQVSLIAVQAGALQVTSTDPQVSEIAKRIRELSVATLTELRYLLSALGPEAMEASQVAPQPGLTELPELLRQSGVDAELVIDADPAAELDHAIQRAVFRIIQEGLTNASKHAPGAEVQVRLSITVDLLVLSIENSAPAPAATSPGGPFPGSGRGLIGAHERVELLQGQFFSGSTGTGGYRMTVKIPLASPSATASLGLSTGTSRPVR